MQYFLGAVVLVCALIGGLLYISSDDRPTEANSNATDTSSNYEQLPEIDLPDYANVVADEARRAELENEAAAFLSGLTDQDQASDEQSNQVLPAAEFSFVDAVDSLLVKGKDRVQVDNHSVPLAEIMRYEGKPLDRNNYYFMHKVTGADSQGIWGIVQANLMKRFADGVAISRGEESERYQVLIPKDADEKLDNGQSSFLGKVLYHKSKESVVYNTWAGERRFGRKVILPEQDVVIIDFTHDELVGIYQYFVTEAQ